MGEENPSDDSQINCTNHKTLYIMKKILLITFALLISYICSAQQYKDTLEYRYGFMIVEKVFEFDIPQENARDAVFRHFQKRIQDSELRYEKLEMNEFEVELKTGILAKFSMNSWISRGLVTMRVEFRPGRMKVYAECERILLESLSSYSAYGNMGYYLENAAPINSKHSVSQTHIPKKAAIETYETLGTVMNRIVNTIDMVVREEAKEMKAKAEAEW